MSMQLKNLFIALALYLLFCYGANAQTVFTNGADVSWLTEMEADGKKFYDYSGDETDCFLLMKECGISAVRLRVWVNPASGTPSNESYGFAWCDKTDVVTKAKRAVAVGLDVMIDFHYSDMFADPSRQSKPKEWKNMTFEQLKTAVAAHTNDVLEALQKENVLPKWIQIGNETRNGMLWPAGQLWTNTGDIPNGWVNFTRLYMAGYDAAKAVFPESVVMPHVDNAYEDNGWWFDKFKANGGKFDMIALSHYPQSYSESAYSINNKAVAQIKALAKKHNVKVMIAEVGVKTNDNMAVAKSVLNDFYDKVKNLQECAGVFYWEPQLYGWWKPEAYNTLGWGAYNMGAFLNNGRPSDVLDCFRNNPTTGISDNKPQISRLINTSHNDIYTIGGRKVTVGDISQLNSGLYITKNKKVIVK